jgi:CHAT domain-containing protein
MSPKRLIRFCRALACFAFGFAVFGWTGWTSDLPRATARSLPSPTPSTIVAEVSQSEAIPLLQRGRQLYASGQFSEAIRVWQDAIARWNRQPAPLDLALTQSYLSLAYQKLGRWQEAREAIAAGVRQIEGLPAQSEQARAVLARLQGARAQLDLELGQPDRALEGWQQAAETYRQLNDTTGATGSQLNQVQALQALGLYARASNTLDEIWQTLETQPDSDIKAAGLQSLGDRFRKFGDLERSRQALQQGLDIARSLEVPGRVADILLSLGNTARNQNDTDAALEFYRESAQTAPSAIAQFQARTNQLSLLAETERNDEARSLWQQLQPQLTDIPANRQTIYARINIAQSLLQLDRGDLAAQVLATAIQQGRQLEDTRAEAYALGNLGSVYEQAEQWNHARDLTRQALTLAQAINAPDIAYRWQWQLGRLLKIRGDRQGAIVAYSEAVNTLKSLRNDLIGVSPDLRFSFRESVEPVYRQLVSLLLQPAGKSDPQASQSNIARARDVLESLRVAELDNFFRDACVDTEPALERVEIDRVDANSALIYPIILSDRLEVILSLGDRPLRHYAIPIPSAKVNETTTRLRRALFSPIRRRSLPLSQSLYDWLIRPIEADLADSGIDNLVFVLDGSLRNVPMAALHDGNNYLVEKYSITVSPGLQLISPTPLNRQGVKILSGGLSQARQGFAPLPNVTVELQRISSTISGKFLLDREFTTDALQRSLNSVSFPILHLATHGQFSSQADETFILTWDGRIDVNELDDLLQSRERQHQSAIELLVLSACETATGDDRAALGLAGVAVRAGARSTLATLWAVNDEATAVLMSQFYAGLLDRNITKAEALRNAQRQLIQTRRYNHPAFWAPYVLVGNWL